ncbi:MAG: hypothetical protein PVI28_08045 [Gammaproteobacteria bacterium]
MRQLTQGEQGLVWPEEEKRGKIMSLLNSPAAAKEEKQWLVEEIENIAAWWALKAGKCRDVSEARCVDALQDLAAAVRALPLSDPLFLKLAETTQLYIEDADISGLECWLEETKHLISRGWVDSSDKPKDLLQRLAALTDKHLTRKQRAASSLH